MTDAEQIADLTARLQAAHVDEVLYRTDIREARDMIETLAAECERGARFIRIYHKNPAELRAWAARIESNLAPNSACVPAEALERGAQVGRDFLAGDHWTDAGKAA